MQTGLSVAAIIISLVALTVSAVIGIRQVQTSRRANQLPVLVNLIQKLRSPEFLARERFVRNELANFRADGVGYSNLPSEAAFNLQNVKSLFNSIGALVAFEIINADLAISIFGFSAKAAWLAIEPFVINERTSRDGNYANYMEHFVALVDERPPEHITASLKLRRPRPAE